MAATSTSPVKILLDLGIDLDNLSSEENYLSALMEGAAAIESATKGKGDGRSAILREEVIRVRKGRKAADPNFKQRGQSFKITKKNISAQKLLTSSKEAKAQTEGGGDLLVIKEKVVAIEALLGEQYKLQEENAKDAKQEAEQKRRSLKERLLEGSGKVFDGVKKATNTVLKPFKSVWENIIGFIKKIILGRVLMNILEWTSDPKNAGKIDSIFKFLGDWWPALLAAYLVFGNGLSKFVIGLTGKLVVLGAKLAAKVIPALIKAAAAMGPYGLAALGVGAVVTGAMLGAKALDGDFDQDKERTDEEKEADKEKADSAMDMGVLSLNKGGTVPGSGNTDTVPAMLTPGEFVMSKGAVQKYGANALAGMNAAAGGTNRPTLMGGYKGGGGPGFANITNTETTSGSGGYGVSYVSPQEAKERLAAMGMPSMELMDGTVVPNFGKMGVDSFNQGIAMVREGMANNPEKLKELDNFLDTNPYAQPDELQRVINSVVPGSQEQVYGDLGDSITASARMNGGGLVKGFQGGGLVLGFQGGGRVRGKSKMYNIKSKTPKNTVVAYEQEVNKNQQQKTAPASGGNEIPSFDVAPIRDPLKMVTLQIVLF